MEYLCCFALGVLAVSVGMALGVFMGKKPDRGRNVGPKQAIDPEMNRMAEEQKAFNRLLSYNRDRAYGLTGEEEELR